jgi:hypothetical protein
MTRRLSRRIIGLAGPVLLACAFVQSAAAAPFSQSPDPSWQTNGRVRAIVYSGTRVYLGGDFTALRPAGGGTAVTRNHLAAIDSSTGGLLPWDPSADDTVWTLAVDPAGSTVYAGGKFKTIGGQARPYSAALDAASGAVRAWDPEPNAIVYVLRVAAPGDVVLGGGFTRVSGHVRNRLAEVGADGSLSSWAPAVKQLSGFGCPPRCPPLVASLAVSPDGSVVYFGGHFGLVNGIPRNNAAAVDAATGATLPWNPDVIGPNPGLNPNQVNKVWDLELGSDRAYLCGDFWSLDGFQRHPNLAAVDLVDGHLIKSFKATTDGNSPTCLARDGVLYVGGHYLRVGPNSAWVIIPGQSATLTGPGSQPRSHIAAFDAVSGAVDGWSPVANSTLGVHALAFSGPRLFVGGDFTTIGHIDQQGFARFSLDTAPPDTVLDSVPPVDSSETAGTFTFHSTEKGSSYRCSLDGLAFSPCKSPASYPGLGDGAHVFEVAAVDAAGNADPSPAAYTWTIPGSAPAPPSGLSATVVSPSRVGLSWTAPPDPGIAAYRVYRDGSLLGQTTQTSYPDTTVVGPASPTYAVRALDGAGNLSDDSNVVQVTTLPTAPPFFTDGFESGDLSRWTTVSDLVVQDSIVYAGLYGARETSSGTATFALRQLVSPASELFYDVRVKGVSRSTQVTLLRFLTASGVPVLRVYATVSGALGYQNERRGTGVTSAGALLSPGWHDLQVRVLLNGTAGEVEFWLDGIRVTDLARTETLGLTPIGRVQLGDEASGHVYDVAFDQVALATSFVVGN